MTHSTPTVPPPPFEPIPLPPSTTPVSAARRRIEARIPAVIAEEEPLSNSLAIMDLPTIARPTQISITAPEPLFDDASSIRSRISTTDALTMATQSEVASSVDYDEWYRSADTDFNFANSEDIFIHSSTQHFDLTASATPRSYRSDHSWVVD